MSDDSPATVPPEAPAAAASAREVVVPSGSALRRADRLAVMALAFVLLGAVGGAILELIYALTE